MQICDKSLPNHSNGIIVVSIVFTKRSNCVLLTAMQDVGLCYSYEPYSFCLPCQSDLCMAKPEISVYSASWVCSLYSSPFPWVGLIRGLENSLPGSFDSWRDILANREVGFLFTKWKHVKHCENFTCTCPSTINIPRRIVFHMSWNYYVMPRSC